MRFSTLAFALGWTNCTVSPAPMSKLLNLRMLRLDAWMTVVSPSLSTLACPRTTCAPWGPANAICGNGAPVAINETSRPLVAARRSGVRWRFFMCAPRALASVDEREREVELIVEFVGGRPGCRHTGQRQ